MRFDVTACGKRIQELRKSHSLTQDQLAEKLRVTCKYIQRIEAGRALGSIELLIDIAAFFNVSTDYLLLGKEHQQKVVKRQLQETILLLQSLEQDRLIPVSSSYTNSIYAAGCLTTERRGWQDLAYQMQWEPRRS